MTDRTKAISVAVFAGAVWGVSFLAPRMLGEYDASTIALFRFLFFGFASALSIVFRWRHFPRIQFTDFIWATLLALLGYSLYYFLLSEGVKRAGIPFSTLIIGLLPLTILLGSIPKFDFRKLALPILLITIGGALIPLELMGEKYGEMLGVSSSDRAIGILLVVIALVSWTLFSILNSRFLKRNPEWNSVEWSSFMGILAALTAAIFFLDFVPGNASTEFTRALSPTFLMVTAFMGIVGAWFTTSLWSYASRILPSALMGQLIVSETVFGLLYGFIYEARFPTLIESLSIVLLVSGGVFGVRAVDRIMLTVK